MSHFNVGFVIFPDLTQLDFTGPKQVLARLPESAMHTVAKSSAPVPSDSGLGLVPTHTFENCPRLDLICVPGGRFGLVQALGDAETIEFVRRQSSTAKYVTFVCTGAFILGVAGTAERASRNHALGIYRATATCRRHSREGSHRQRRQRNHRRWRHLGHRLWLAEIAGEIVAQAIQLGIEYDPKPPFDSGHPDRAPESAQRAVAAQYEAARAAFRAGLARAIML